MRSPARKPAFLGRRLPIHAVDQGTTAHAGAAYAAYAEAEIAAWHLAFARSMRLGDTARHRCRDRKRHIATKQIAAGIDSNDAPGQIDQRTA